MLSIDAGTLPEDAKAAGKKSYRSLIIDGEALEFNEGFEDLHTRSYEEIIAGKGFPIRETKKLIELLHDIRNTK